MTRQLLALFLLSSCIEGPGEVRLEMPANFTNYKERIQPEMAASCANPSCHGTPARPMELYAVRQHRFDPDQVYADTQLTELELWMNFQRICGFVVEVDAPADCEVLQKPLATEAGGAGHVGGAQYDDTDHPAYQLLLEWLEAGPGGLP